MGVVRALACGLRRGWRAWPASCRLPLTQAAFILWRVETRAPSAELDGFRVVTLPAGIDLDNAEQVHTMLTGVLAAGVSVVVADMAATGYCTLEGVQALLRAHRATGAAGAQLRLAQVRPGIQRVLELTGTIRLLRPYPTLDAARAGEAARPAALALIPGIAPNLPGVVCRRDR